MKHDVTFMYTLETDEGFCAKEIIIRLDDLDPRTLVSAFQEFCTCVGLEVDYAVVTDEEDDSSVH